MTSTSSSRSVNGTASKTQTVAISELAQYVPLRLNSEERALLAVLEQTLNVSEYTDHVDTTISRRGGLKTRRILDGIVEACHIATGLAVASCQEKMLANICHDEALLVPSWRNKKSKKQKKKKKKKRPVAALETDGDGDNGGTNKPPSGLWAAREPHDNAALFQTMFEIGRRNKVLNPTSMRATYGKMMYLLQDAQNPTVAKSLGFSLHKDLVLVKTFLEQYGCGSLLDDARLECAIQHIHNRDEVSGELLERSLVDSMIQGKRRVTEELVQHYSTKVGSTLSADNVRRAIESLADATAYIESNVQPVQMMLRYLETCFDPENGEPPFSLTLRGASRGGYSSSYAKYGLSAYSHGSDGPTLSHSHGTQFVFVQQSLRLWCRVMRNMHRLWICADDDLLSTAQSYHLFNTGQGLNRVQSCPKVRKVMSHLLHQTQMETGGSWVGLSVIHLGDRDVPNALIFIDKYTQIPRFLAPLVHFLQNLDDLCRDGRMAQYVEHEFGSIRALRMTVLADYFKHGFDGSGDDGGSCIDGRLTSSWNWTSKLAKKSYYHAFMLSGFQGFDGSFS